MDVRKASRQWSALQSAFSLGSNKRPGIVSTHSCARGLACVAPRSCWDSSDRLGGFGGYVADRKRSISQRVAIGVLQELLLSNVGYGGPPE